MNPTSDISLVAQVIVFKNKKAFDLLVKKHQSPIRRFFLNLTLGDTETSNDLAQETFIKAYVNLTDFRNLSGFSTWLYKIAYNVFYDYIRSRKEFTDLNTCKIDSLYNTQQKDVGQTMDIYSSLQVLSEKERSCIILFYMEDITAEKIAGILNCPLATVKSHLLRAKEKISVYLKQNGYDGNR